VSGRRSRRLVGAPRAQHFLGEAAVAAAIVETAGVSADDFVLEFGAGYGRLTEHLALRSGRVVAVETDARPAARLTHRFRGRANVTVVPADALTVPLPRRPFKVVSNPPFHITSALLHRLLDDPNILLLRADLVVGWGSALALTGVFGPAHKARPWLSRYEFLLIRRRGSCSTHHPPMTPRSSRSAGGYCGKRDREECCGLCRPGGWLRRARTAVPHRPVRPFAVRHQAGDAHHAPHGPPASFMSGWRRCSCCRFWGGLLFAAQRTEAQAISPPANAGAASERLCRANLSRSAPGATAFAPLQPGHRRQWAGGALVPGLPAGRRDARNRAARPGSGHSERSASVSAGPHPQRGQFVVDSEQPVQHVPWGSTS
jgi:SAM-dependent methyltransferase